jgi:hypothetical protein
MEKLTSFGSHFCFFGGKYHQISKNQISKIKKNSHISIWV